LTILTILVFRIGFFSLFFIAVHFVCELNSYICIIQRPFIKRKAAHAEVNVTT